MAFHISQGLSDEEIEEWKKEILLIDSQLSHSSSVSILKASQPEGGQADSQKLKEPPDLLEIKSTPPEQISASIHNCRVLNLACQDTLKKIEKQLLEKLKVNREEQEKLKRYLQSNKEESDGSSQAPRFKCLGIPYFKDANGFPQPHNQDHEEKVKMRQLTASEFITGCRNWSSADILKLEKSVQENDKKMKIDILCKKKLDITDSNCKMDNQEQSYIKDIEEQITTLQTLPLHAFTPEICSIDWLKIANCDMDGKYTPEECESKWKYDLSPKINKNSWTQKELKSLYVIAEENNCEDWRLIAKELNTNRTELQCCIKYMTTRGISDGKWTEAEDAKLRELIAKYSTKNYIPWRKVSWHYKTRSLRQCFERYTYSLNYTKKGVFDEKEDKIIVFGAKEFDCDFSKIAKLLPERSINQIRSRYEYLVATTMPDFTEAEDKLLLQLIQLYPKDWTKISEYFDTRSALQCRWRWRILSTKVLKNKSGSDTDYERDEIDDILANQQIPRLVALAKKSIKNVDGSSESLLQYVQESLPESMKRDGDLGENLEPKACKRRKHKTLSDKLVELAKFLEYGHEFLFGPKPRTSTVEDTAASLCSKMKISMSVLSAEYSLSSKMNALQRASYLEEVTSEDVNVLNRLIEDDAKRTGDVAVNNLNYDGPCINNFSIPPNYTTLVGLRTLLLANNHVRNSAHHDPVYTNENYDLTVNPTERLLFFDAKELWKSRIKTLFMLPMIMAHIPKEGAAEVIKLKAARCKPLSKRKLKAHVLHMTRMKKLLREQTEGVPVETKNKKKAAKPSHTSKRGRPRKVPLDEMSEIFTTPESKSSSPPPKRAKMIRVERARRPSKR